MIIEPQYCQACLVGEYEHTCRDKGLKESHHKGPLLLYKLKLSTNGLVKLYDDNMLLLEVSTISSPIEIDLDSLRVYGPLKIIYSKHTKFKLIKSRLT